jgi:hypothetical protein
LTWPTAPQGDVAVLDRTPAIRPTDCRSRAGLRKAPPAAHSLITTPALGVGCEADQREEIQRLDSREPVNHAPFE